MSLSGEMGQIFNKTQAGFDIKHSKYSHSFVFLSPPVSADQTAVEACQTSHP